MKKWLWGDISVIQCRIMVLVHFFSLSSIYKLSFISIPVFSPRNGPDRHSLWKKMVKGK